MRRSATACAPLIVAAIALGACAKDTTDQSSIQVVDPGRCTPVDVVADPAITPVVSELASQFNDAPAAHANDKACTKVRIQSIESATAARELINGWTNTTDYGPAPAVWIPASSAWTAYVDQKLAAARERSIADGGTPLARTPLVVAMPAPMAHALGWPGRRIGWRDLAQLAANPRGWTAHGHPEWGAFKLGKASPVLNTSGLLATVAAGELGDPAAARALESAVVYYGDSSAAFLDSWYRLDKQHAPLTFVSAVITDERLVTAYNEGNPTGTPGQSGAPPHVPLVAITPSDGAFESDYPITPIRALWVDDAAGPGVAAFTAFARSAASQGKVVAAGFRAGGRPDDVALAAFQRTASDVDNWMTIRKHARVMLLVDESDSMGDAADWRNLPTPRVTLVKQALLRALAQFGPEDEVGLRVFTTGFHGGPSPYWAEVVPIRRFTGKQRAALVTAVHGLTHRKGSPLYAAAHDAFDAVNRSYDRTRVNGVVLITDGYNELDQLNDRDALLKHLHEPVRMFTVAFTSDADLKTLRKMAQATNGRVYDATDPQLIDSAIVDAVGNF
jgi:Ca-activated chloride channel family protein